MAGEFGNGLKSVQRGQKELADAAVSDTVTITAVDMTKAWLVFSFQGTQTTCMGDITNSTTLTFTRSGTAAIFYIEWQVIEFY